MILEKKHILRGLKVFILLTFGSLAVIFVAEASGESLRAIVEFKKSYLVLALLLSGTDLFLGGLRIHVFFTKKILKKVSLLDCIRANLANMFVAAVTPSQTGGGPAQLYILNRAGAPLSGAMSVSIINFFSSLFFFLISILFISITLPRAVVDLKLDQVIRYGIVVVVLILATVVLLVVKPQLLNWLLQKITAVSGYIWKKNRGKRISEKIAENVIQFKDYIYLFLTKERPTLFLSFGITVVLYLNKYLIAYVIVKGLNLSPSLWDVFYIQTLQFFLLYFSPTPGSAGAAEVSSAFLMSKLVPLYQLPVFVVLWRFFVTYVGVTLGGWITIRDLNEFFKEKEMQAEKIAQKPQLASS